MESVGGAEITNVKDWVARGGSADYYNHMMGTTDDTHAFQLYSGAFELIGAGQLSHDDELAQYGVIEYGFSATFSGALLVGETVEIGWVATDKNYVRYYMTTSYTHGLARPSVNGNLIIRISGTKPGYDPTFLDWNGISGSINLGSGALGAGVSSGGTYGTVSISFGTSVGKLPKAIKDILESKSATFSVGKTTWLSQPFQMSTSPMSLVNQWLNMYNY